MDVPLDSVMPDEDAFFMGHRAAPHGRGRVGESSGGSAPGRPLLGADSIGECSSALNQIPLVCS